MERNRIAAARRRELDELLNDAFFIYSPKPNDYQQRRSLVHRLKAMATEAFGNSQESPVIEVFGSFVMDMFSPGSDLDVSMNFRYNGFEYPREKKIKALRKFSKKLNTLQRKGLVDDVQLILGARVPIVKVTDCETGIECDLSVENRDGVNKSQIIYAISTIDERFHKLCILLKVWAKGHNINSSKDRSLNSLSIISLVAFHLQTRDPPILPPFIELLKDGNNPASVMKLVPSYLEYAKRNKESLGDLFFTFIAKLETVEKLWDTGLCASSYLGSWISKTKSELDFMNVEDFTDRSQNVARAVGFHGFKSIYDCIHNSFHHLLAFMNGEVHKSKLRELLFPVFSPSGMGVTYFDHIAASGPRLLMGDWEVKQGTEGWDDWAAQKRTGFAENSSRKRKERTEGWDDWGIKERTGSRDGLKTEITRDVKSEAHRYRQNRTDAASHVASPVSRHRPYVADSYDAQFPPTVASLASPVASQYGNKVHYSNFPSDSYETQFPPPVASRANGRELEYPFPPERRFDSPVYSPIHLIPSSRRNVDNRTQTDQNDHSGFGRPDRYKRW